MTDEEKKLFTATYEAVRAVYKPLGDWHARNVASRAVDAALEEHRRQVSSEAMVTGEGYISHGKGGNFDGECG